MTFWEPGVLRPRGATWSGQVISSPPGPSGGPFMPHLLPGGAVPWVHGAGSPVAPRLPHFATPWSVRHLADVVAGAYPLRRPPDAWSPGLPARRGPCYLLVASGTPTGWHGGCPAPGLMPTTVCYYYLGGCSALVVCARRTALVGAVPWSCVRGARGRSGGSGPVPVLAPPFPRGPRSERCGLSRPGVPSLRLPVLHSMRSVRSAGSVSLPFGSAPCVCWVWVRSCSCSVRACPPPAGWMWCLLRALLVQGASRALPDGSRPSAFPVLVPYSVFLALQGVARSLRPLASLGVAHPSAGGPALASWRCAPWGSTRAPRGERLLPGCAAFGVGRSPTPDRPSLGRVARDRYPLAVGAGGAGLGTRHQPHSARSCELALRAMGPAQGRSGGGARLAWVWSARGWALSHAPMPILGA